MTDAIPVTKSGKDPYTFTYRDPQVVEWCTAEVDVQNPNGIVVKTMSREPVHPVREYQWPPELRVQRAFHTSLTKPKWNCYGRSAQVVWWIGRATRGGINGKRIWDPGGEREESLFTAGRCGKKERKARQERMRWRGTSWESLPGGKHLGFEVPVEPQGRCGCWW